MNEIIKIENLHKQFGTLEVLKGIDLSVSKGEILTIIGPSGSGKSTLLRCMNHLEEANRGSIAIDGRYICKENQGGKSVYLSNGEILKICSKLGMVFQNFNLLPNLTAKENVMLSMDITRRSHLKANGGYGYDFLLTTFIPQLRQSGFSQADVDVMLRENPSQFFQ